MAIDHGAEANHQPDVSFESGSIVPESGLGVDWQNRDDVLPDNLGYPDNEDPIVAAQKRVEDSYAVASDFGDAAGSGDAPIVPAFPRLSQPTGIDAERPGKSHVRRAEERDLDRLAEIDLMMFDKAYGQDVPKHSEVKEMMARRLGNIKDGGGGMFVCEVDGEVNAFATYFRTNKPWEEFTTWEDTTNNGTLDGVVEPEGRYAYVVNMTVAPRASKVRGMQKVVANMFASAITEGLEYGYFVSRIPQLTQWMQEKGIDYTTRSPEELDALAAEYITTTTISRKGKEEPYDYELRTYLRSGFKEGSLVKGGFSDEESLNYGVTFRVDTPLTNLPRPFRRIAAAGLSLAARSTKLAGKLF